MGSGEEFRTMEIRMKSLGFPANLEAFGATRLNKFDEEDKLETFEHVDLSVRAKPPAAFYRKALAATDKFLKVEDAEGTTTDDDSIEADVRGMNGYMSLCVGDPCPTIFRSLGHCLFGAVVRDDEVGVTSTNGVSIGETTSQRLAEPLILMGGFAFNTGKDLLPLKKSGQDGDGGRVNVGSGVDNSNNKLRIRLSGIKLTDEDLGVLGRALKNNSLPLFQA
ncbi:hypothetical protein Tco_0690244, partial [Tanacetum coccineum]